MFEYVTFKDISYSYKINFFKKIIVNVPAGTHFISIPNGGNNFLCTFNRHIVSYFNEHSFSVDEIFSFSKKI